MGGRWEDMLLTFTAAVICEGTGCEKGLGEAESKAGKGTDDDYTYVKTGSNFTIQTCCLWSLLFFISDVL